MVRKFIKKTTAVLLCAAVAAGLMGCGSVTSGKRIIRVSHAQSETHPEHIGLLAFKEYVEEHLGDKYEVQIFPNEILGSAQKAIELTQTGAIDFVIAGTANLETFADVYEIFSMPYLFDSEEVYRSVMEDTDYMENIYKKPFVLSTSLLFHYTSLYFSNRLRGTKHRTEYLVYGW